jgi:hypothetical protein
MEEEWESLLASLEELAKFDALLASKIFVAAVCMRSARSLEELAQVRLYLFGPRRRH